MIHLTIITTIHTQTHIYVVVHTFDYDCLTLLITRHPSSAIYHQCRALPLILSVTCVPHATSLPHTHTRHKHLIDTIPHLILLAIPVLHATSSPGATSHDFDTSLSCCSHACISRGEPADKCARTLPCLCMYIYIYMYVYM